MGIRIEPIDPSSDGDLATVAELNTAYAREVIGPDEPATPASVVRDGLRLDRSDIDKTVLLARDGDRPVGFASVDIRLGMGNEHMAWVEDVYVLAGHRRRGTGRALLDAVIEIARTANRSLILGGFHDGGKDGEAFAAAVGGQAGHREHQNRVAVAELDRTMLERWVADAADGASEYSLVTYDNRCPDDLREAVARAAGAMNDAPRTEKLEDSVFTAKHHRAVEAERARAGITYWYVAARHDDTGELAGYTELDRHRETPWVAEQGDTGVVAAHRGHGIGRWVKAVNALRLLDEWPEARFIETWNDGTNRWMLAINDAMGFRPVATWVEVELEL